VNRSRLLVVTGIAALAVAGCGSNKSLSYSGLADQANAICKSGTAEIGKLKTANAQADVIEKKYLPRLEKLKAPDALKPSLDRFISITKQQITAIRANDNKSLKKLSQESDLAASKMGAKDCIGG
jgi:hypothetical protein